MGGQAGAKYRGWDMGMIPDTCPKCRRDLRAGEIPGDQRTGLETHYSHVIAVYDRGRDRTVAWRCPFCGHEWR